jgi:hypothetical protein
MLAKFVTTEKDWEEQKRLNPNGMGAGSFGPGTRYTLYKSLEGGIADAQEWGTGYTNDQSKIKLPTKSAG